MGSYNQNTITVKASLERVWPLGFHIETAHETCHCNTVIILSSVVAVTMSSLGVDVTMSSLGVDITVSPPGVDVTMSSPHVDVTMSSSDVVMTTLQEELPGKNYLL